MAESITEDKTRTGIYDLDTNDEEEKVLVPHRENQSFIKVNRLITVEPAVLLYIMYGAGISPLIQQYIVARIEVSQNLTKSYHNVCEISAEFSNKHQNEAESQASLWLAGMNGVSLIPLLISSLIFGSLSDKIGRKIALLLPLIGAMLSLVLCVLIVQFELSLYSVLLVKIADSICGGFPLFYSGAFSYISDVTNLEQRKLRIIVIEVLISFGIAISDVGTGYLIQWTNYKIPFYVFMGIVFINFIYIIFLPKSFASIPFKEAVTNIETFIKIPRKSITIYLHDTNEKRRWKLQSIALVMFITCWCDLGRTDVATLYVLASPFCFSSVLIGYYICITCIVPAVGSISLTKLCQNYLQELSFMVIGIVSSISWMLALAFSRSGVAVFSVTGFGLLSKLTIGMLRSFSSKQMKQDEQGAMFASIAWLEGASYILGSVTFDLLYRATDHLYDGFVFFIITAVYILDLCIVCLIHIGHEKQEKRQSLVININDGENYY